MKNFEKYKTPDERYDAFDKECRGNDGCNTCRIKKSLGICRLKNIWQCMLHWLELDAVEEKEDCELAINEASLIKWHLHGLHVNFCFVLNKSAFEGLVKKGNWIDINGRPVTEKTPSSDISFFGTPCCVEPDSDRPVYAKVWMECWVKQ